MGHLRRYSRWYSKIETMEEGNMIDQQEAQEIGGWKGFVILCLAVLVVLSPAYLAEISRPSGIALSFFQVACLMGFFLIMAIRGEQMRREVRDASDHL